MYLVIYVFIYLFICPFIYIFMCVCLTRSIFVYFIYCNTFLMNDVEVHIRSWLQTRYPFTKKERVAAKLN